MIIFTWEFVRKLTPPMAGPSWIAGKVWGACLFASAFISLNHKLRGIKGLASKDIGNGGVSQRLACVGIL